MNKKETWEKEWGKAAEHNVIEQIVAFTHDEWVDVMLE